MATVTPQTRMSESDTTRNEDLYQSILAGLQWLKDSEQGLEGEYVAQQLEIMDADIWDLIDSIREEV